MNKKTDVEESGPDPNVQSAKGAFTFPNGDNYTGEYCAHKYGLIWREGLGIYTTVDGQTYEGAWKDDKLVENKEFVVKFPTGEQYIGRIVQNKYIGPGIYTMENQMDVSCEFADNRPKGNIILIDINGRIWQGKAGENGALLLPENNFYLDILENAGIGKLKLKYEIDEELSNMEEGQQEENVLSDRELEQLIFAKSAKTYDDIDFLQSKWYQRYARYRTMKDTIVRKLSAETQQGEEEEEKLTEEEKKWYKKYRKHRVLEKQKKSMSKRTSMVDTSLLKTFYSKEFDSSCPPIKVFHPRCDWEEKAEEIQSGNVQKN